VGDVEAVGEVQQEHGKVQRAKRGRGGGSSRGLCCRGKVDCLEVSVLGSTWEKRVPQDGGTRTRVDTVKVIGHLLLKEMGDLQVGEGAFGRMRDGRQRYMRGGEEFACLSAIMGGGLFGTETCGEGGGMCKRIRRNSKSKVGGWTRQKIIGRNFLLRRRSDRIKKGNWQKRGLLYKVEVYFYQGLQKMCMQLVNYGEREQRLCRSHEKASERSSRSERVPPETQRDTDQQLTYRGIDFRKGRGRGGARAKEKRSWESTLFLGQQAGGALSAECKRGGPSAAVDAMKVR